MKLLVTGITGTVGSEVLRQAILDNSITSIFALGRNAPEVIHPKIQFINHSNFLDYSGLGKIISECDYCLWCLGISQSQVSKEKYQEITFDYTIAAAKAIQLYNPKCSFMFVSGDGADPSGKTKMLFGKVKGATEKALAQMDFPHFYSVRPGGIQPIHQHKNIALVNKIMIPFYPIIKILAPSVMITSVQLAQAMLAIIKESGPKSIYENIDLLNIAKNINPR